MIALIDGDILVYKAAYATEYTVYDTEDGQEFRRKAELTGFFMMNYDEDEAEDYLAKAKPRTVTEPISVTSAILQNIITKISQATNANQIKILLSKSGPKFRDLVKYPVQYKGGRPPKPANFEATYNLLASQPTTSLVSGIEVDDALGIMQNESTVICSIDKDLLQIPGLHYNIDKETITTISERDGVYKFWHQMLTGDRVDNIIGLQGVGEKTATKLLADHGMDSWEGIVKGEYLKADRMDIYEANKVLLKILREPGDYVYQITP